MIKGLSSRKNELQLVIMIVISLLGQIVSLYKSVYTAGQFGASSEMDAYNYGLNIVSFFVTFATTGITTVALPAYIKNRDRKSIDAFLTMVLGILTAILAAMYLLRKPIVEIFTEREAIFNDFFVSSLFKVILMQGITTFLGITTAFFQTRNKFVAPKVIVFASNLLVLILLIILPPQSMDKYLNILLMGNVVNIIADIIVAIKLGFRFKPNFDVRNAEVMELFSIFIPTLFSCGVYKIQNFIDSLITTNLSIGYITILTYSLQIVNMINSFILGNLTTYAYPHIVKDYEFGKGQKTLVKYTILLQAIIGVFVVGFIAVGKNSVSLLFERKNFTSEDVYIVYICTAIFITGQLVIVGRDLIFRFFYAAEDIVSTVKNSVIASVSNILLSITLSQILGLYGIVIGTVCSGFISYVLSMVMLKKKFGFKNEIVQIIIELIKILISIGITAIVVQFTKYYFIIENRVLSIGGYGILTVVAYISMLYCFKSKALKMKL